MSKPEVLDSINELKTAFERYVENGIKVDKVVDREVKVQSRKKKSITLVKHIAYAIFAFILLLWC